MAGTGYPAPPAYYAASEAPPGYGWKPFAPRPGIVPLRPLGVGELLDGGFTTIRRYPGSALGFSAMVVLVVQVIQTVATYVALHGVTNNLNYSIQHNTTFASQGNFLARTYSVQGLVLVVSFFATLLISGLLSVVVSDGVLGRPLRLAQAWDRTRPAIWRLAGVSAAVAGITIGIVLLGVLPGVIVAIAANEDAGVGLAVIGGLAAGMYAIYLGVSFQLAGAVVVLENGGIGFALRRSRALVRGSWWRVFGIGLLAGLIATIVSGIIALPFAFAGGLSAIFSGNTDSIYTFHALVITGVGGFLAGTLVRPFSAAVVTLLYVDRRMRAEGLDLTLAEAAGVTAAGPAR